jgi:hypothetical protein
MKSFALNMRLRFFHSGIISKLSEAKQAEISAHTLQ